MHSVVWSVESASMAEPGPDALVVPGGGRTIVSLAALVALAGFFLPWLLVLLPIDWTGTMGIEHTTQRVYFVLLDSSGYDLTFGRLAGQRIGEARDVEGSGEYLAFLLGPIVLAVLPAAHRLLGARDRLATPIVVALAALCLGGFLLDRLYLDARRTVRTESEKRVDARRAESAEVSFDIVEKESVLRHGIGFWMALFGYAGILSGSIAWYREGMRLPEPVPR